MLMVYNLTKNFVVIIEKIGKDYVASVPALYGCCVQTKKLKNLADASIKAVRHYLQTDKDMEKFDFAGIRILRISHYGEFCVAIEKGEAVGYIASVPSMAGCFTQAMTIDGLLKNVEELLRFYLKEGKRTKKTEFVGMQMIEV
jgi:predicted RNase H-like HicB family nuclease